MKFSINHLAVGTRRNGSCTEEQEINELANIEAGLYPGLEEWKKTALPWSPSRDEDQFPLSSCLYMARVE